MFFAVQTLTPPPGLRVCCDRPGSQGLEAVNEL